MYFSVEFRRGVLGKYGNREPGTILGWGFFFLSFTSLSPRSPFDAGDAGTDHDVRGGKGGGHTPSIYIPPRQYFLISVTFLLLSYGNHTVACRIYLALAIRLGRANSARRGGSWERTAKGVWADRSEWIMIYGYPVQTECVHNVKMTRMPGWKYTHTHTYDVPTYLHILQTCNSPLTIRPPLHPRPLHAPLLPSSFTISTALARLRFNITSIPSVTTLLLQPPQILHRQLLPPSITRRARQALHPQVQWLLRRV
jgi:hypothetical protein